MRSILILNPKGGSGKTTVATNLAGALAARHERVFLWDLDRQRSSLLWLSIRPVHMPEIRRLDEREKLDQAALPDDWLVIDSPAGLHGKSLTHVLKLADKVLIPLQPSMFDLAATRDFLELLRDEKTIRKNRTFIGVLGVRVDSRTRAAATLEAFLRDLDLPVLGYLRNSQLYPNAAFNGLSLFDLPQHVTSRDMEQWDPVLSWVFRDR